jgi:cytochrome c553
MSDKHKPHTVTALGRCLALVPALLGGLLLSAPVLAEDAKTIATTICVGCHGADGNSVIPMFPKIAGLQESYIVKQLRDFQSGRRKSDIMAPVLAGLKPEDIAPLASYFSQQKMLPGEGVDKPLTAVGKLLFFDGNEETGVPACVGCHKPLGAGFQIYPRIGGQHVQYVSQQLKNFASGDRNNDVSRFMRVVAKRMSEEEIQSVADYLVSLDAK